MSTSSPSSKGKMKMSSWAEETDEEQDNLNDYFMQIQIDDPNVQVVFESSGSPRKLAEPGKMELCECREPVTVNSALELLNSVINSDLTEENYNCLIDNIIRGLNKVLNSSEDLTVEKIAAADLFYKARHELLFKVFCKSFNLNAEHSDRPFRDFGIDSNRTPDFLEMIDNLLVIVEITAMSNLDRAASSKGIESAGFEGKYKKEVDLFEEMGIPCKYFVVFFDMSDPNYKIDKEIINELCNYFKLNVSFLPLLNIVSNSLANLTLQNRNLLTLPSTVLFSQWVEITPDHKGHQFLYSTGTIKTQKPFFKKYEYKTLTVSTQVYTKITNTWPYLFNILSSAIERQKERVTTDFKWIFVLNTQNNRITAERNTAGATEGELMGLLNKMNKYEFFKNLKLKVGNTLIDSTDSDNGFSFHERVEKITSKKNIDIRNLLIVDHDPIQFHNSFNIDPYNKYKKKLNFMTMNSNYEDPEYENVLLKCISDYDQSDLKFDNPAFEDLLGNQELKDMDIDEIFNKIVDGYKEVNTFDDSLPKRIQKSKSPFILPLADLNSKSYSEIGYKNLDLMKSVVNLIGSTDPYTTIVLKNAMNENYKMKSDAKQESQVLESLKEKRITESNKMNKLQKEYYRSNRMKGSLKISQTTDEVFKERFSIIKAELSRVNKLIKDSYKNEGFNRNVSLIRMPAQSRNTRSKKRQAAENKLSDKESIKLSKPDSLLTKHFKKEMAHFKDGRFQSTIEGVGIRKDINFDYEQDKSIFDSIVNLLVVNRGENIDPLIDLKTQDDVTLLRDLKEAALENYKGLINSVKNSYLGHASALVSRMAHSLMFYSQLPFNSSYVRVDNLGYKDVLLIVKGGKKIFQSKASKLYRILYPISPEFIPWYNSTRIECSTKILKIWDRWYALTPWSMLHESVLTDSLSFYTRVCSFTTLNLNPEIDFRSQLIKISTNVLLAFHNRRQTEVLLANLRYILLATMGDFTGIKDILVEFFGFNYDCFQSFIRGSIYKNYSIYFKKMLNIKSKKMGKEINSTDFETSSIRNIFSGNILKSSEDLALMIYSTFLMTKAPYQRVAERASNLKGILKIHELYDNTVGLGKNPEEQFKEISVECNGNLIDYKNDLFKNDFSFDPKYCSLVGRFIDSYFNEKDLKDDFHNEWFKIMNSAWDEMATSTGLRGNINDAEMFWGKKGYFVVYKKILYDNNFRDNLLKVFCGEMDHDEKRKMLRSMNEVFCEKTSSDQEFLIFHAVDKTQWRGGREIYVMDLETKIMQQPIEKFMGYLCKNMDNELISIPSDKRAQVIHHSIFEKDLPLKDVLTWYLTLDCTKWAPKSVFSKFITSLLSMDTIPDSFKIHFLNYSEKLSLKRIYFNVAEVDAVILNPKFMEAGKKYLIYDEEVKGYYMNMPYSWVMGIFNYTSSFLHAANQKYFSYLLTKSTMNSYSEETSMVMLAHSDDSGGRLTAPNIELAKRALVLYEINLKCCNHLLSKKKSVVSRIYFEILSVIYLFKKLLALLPKFLGGLRFLPTDKGPAQDMLQSYSKCIEVMIAGADFSVAYLVLKFYSMLIWRFYYNREMVTEDYNRPLQYLGVPDAHPLMILLCGSDADLLRIMMFKKDNLKSLMALSNNLMSSIDGEGPVKSYKFRIKVKNIDKDFLDYCEIFEKCTESWSVRNVNYHNTAMNSLSFLRKLSDPGFIGSLVNESVVRRISRCYYIRNNHSCVTNFGDLKLKDVCNVLILFQKYVVKDNAVRDILVSLFKEEDLDEIQKDYIFTLSKMDKELLLLEKTLMSPIKICKYFNQLSLKNKKINHCIRTLKPTQLQLVKTAKVFSTNFDPASLVSYIKEPEMRWAINNLRGLISGSEDLSSLLSTLNLTMDEVSPDNLLRVCRTYGKENVKDLYLYSRVPSEIRQVKSYSAFLSFLSVNSFENKEIQGFVVKLSNKDMAREYVENNIGEEVYLINNIISLLIVMVEKCSPDFVSSIRVKNVNEISWDGGSCGEFLKYVEDYMFAESGKTFILPSLKFLNYKLNVSSLYAYEINEFAFYTFLRSQKSKSNWYGKGEVYINIERSFYSFEIYNSKITKAYTNQSGKVKTSHSNFIRDVLNNININISSLSKSDQTGKDYFGFDYTGNMAIGARREIENGCPVEILNSRGDINDVLRTGQIVDFKKDSFLVKSTLYDEPVFRKIFTIPVLKTDLLSIIKMYFRKEDFETKLAEIGLNDFEEFIYTEVLTEYGQDLYIGFDDLLDNYRSSVLFKIFKTVRQNSISVLPTCLKNSPMPASEGSLTRILIDYSNYTNDRVVKTSNDLDPEIMKLRSEYPEQVTAILCEKLIDYHEKIYTLKEQSEINNMYQTLVSTNDLEVMRESVIKLMTHWGYGALVNSLVGYSLVRTNKNYLYFNHSISSESKKPIISKLYPKLIGIITSTMLEYAPMYRGLSLPYLNIQPKLKISEIIELKIKEDILELYNYTCLSTQIGIYTLFFYNSLIGYLEDENFCNSVQLKMSKDYILGSLPFDFSNRKNILLLLNNLRDCWSRNNSIKFELNYLSQNQRLPSNIINFRSFMSDFGIKTNPADNYYNGFLTEDLMSYLRKKCTIYTEKANYNIYPGIARKSKHLVPTTEEFKFSGPIKESVLQSDEWQDIMYEFELEDLDVETIESMIEDIEDFYEQDSKSQPIFKRGKRNVYNMDIRWIIDPHTACTWNNVERYRQVAKNIIVLTNTYISKWTKLFNNSGIRLVNYTKQTNGFNRPMLAHYTFCDELNNKEFIEDYIGGVIYSVERNIIDNLSITKIRNKEGEICQAHQLGNANVIDILVGNYVEVELEDGTIVQKKRQIEEVEENNGDTNTESVIEISSEEENKIKEITFRRKKIEEITSKLKNEGLSEEFCNNLLSKYNSKTLIEGTSRRLFLASLMSEGELNIVREAAVLGNLELTEKQYTNSYQHPTALKAVTTANVPTTKLIKNPKLGSEVRTAGDCDADIKVVSSKLTISLRMMNLIEANYMMWSNMAKFSEFKRDSKYFGLTKFLTVYASAQVSTPNCDKTEDDNFWQTYINNMTIYMARGMDKKEGEEILDEMFSGEISSRLTYRGVGN